jgi:glutathione S-transferase
MFAIFRARSEEEKEATSKEWVSAVAKDIEPLLKSANPFFGGSSELTLAEVWYFLQTRGEREGGFLC